MGRLCQYIRREEDTANLAGAGLMEAGNNWVPLALSDAKLLIRDQKKLMVVQVAHQGR